MIERIYLSKSPALRKLAYRYLKDEQAAADVVQQSALDFMEIFHTLTYVSESKLCGYLYIITKNNIFDVLGKNGREFPAETLENHAEQMDAEALGAALAERGIAVRAGLHCAPLAHRTAGTLNTGTVRLSFSHWNTREEVDRLLEAVGEIFQ